MELNVQGSHTKDTSPMGCDTGSMDEQFHHFQSMAASSRTGITPLRLSDPKDESTITLQNANNYLPNDTA